MVPQGPITSMHLCFLRCIFIFLLLKTTPGRNCCSTRGPMYMFVYVENVFVLFIPSGNDDTDNDSWLMTQDFNKFVTEKPLSSALCGRTTKTKWVICILYKKKIIWYSDLGSMLHFGGNVLMFCQSPETPGLTFILFYKQLLSQTFILHIFNLSQHR